MPIASGEGGSRCRAQVPSPTREAIARDWDEYRTGSVPARNRLVAHYMSSLVRPIATRQHARVPQHVDLDDLVQQGYLGLVEAMGRYNPARNTLFEGYARQRVGGAIQDYLRELDPVPRLCRMRWKKIQAERERFHKAHGRPPADDELCPLVDVPDAAVTALLTGPPPGSLVPFSNVHPEGADASNGDGDAMDAFEDPTDAPSVTVQRDDVQRWLVRGFDDRDRLIIVLYYYEHLTMREIGTAAGISESRVSQRLDEIVQRLRARMTRDPSAERELR